MDLLDVLNNNPELNPITKAQSVNNASAIKSNALDLVSAEKHARLNPGRLPRSTNEFNLLNPLATQEQITQFNADKFVQDTQDSIQNERNQLQVDLDRPRSVSDFIKDTAIGLGGKGALGVGQVAAGAADLVSRFNPVTFFDALQNKIQGGEFDAVNIPSFDELTAKASKALGGAGESISQKLNETRAILDDAQSDRLKAGRASIAQSTADRKKINEATRPDDPTLLQQAGNIGEDFISGVGDFVDNPSVAFDGFLESLPQMIGPGAIAGQITKQVTSKTSAVVAERFLASKAGKAAANKIATASGVGFAAASEGISNGIQVQGEILSASHEDLLDSSPQYAKLIEEGVSKDKAKRQLADKAGLITTGVAGLFGGISSKLSGAAKFEGSLFRVNSKIGRNILTKTTEASVRGAVTEGIEETAQGAAGQFASNLGRQQTVDPTQSLSEGVVDSAAAGLAVGALSGGALAGAASIPNSAKETAKRIVDKATEKTGNSPAVKEALKTGDTSKVFETDDNNKLKDPVSATALLLKKIPTDPSKLKQHINFIRLGINEVVEKFKDVKPTTAQRKLVNEFLTQVKQLDQRHLNEEKPKVAEFVDDIKGDNATKGDATTNKIDTSLNTFGNTPISSKAEADVLTSQANTILDSKLASKGQSERLQSTIDTAKTFNDVTNSIFNTRSDNFISINEHKSIITSAIENNNESATTDALTNLTKFRDDHVTKLDQLSKAFEAFKKPNKTPEDIKSIAIANNRVNLQGKKFVVGGGTGTIIDTIKQEVVALNAATNEMTLLASAPFTGPQINTTIEPIKNTDIPQPVPRQLPSTGNTTIDSFIQNNPDNVLANTILNSIQDRPLSKFAAKKFLKQIPDATETVVATEGANPTVADTGAVEQRLTTNLFEQATSTETHTNKVTGVEVNTGSTTPLSDAYSAIKVDNPSVLSTTPDMFNQVKLSVTNKVDLPTSITETLSDIQINSLPNIQKFESEFTKKLTKGIKGKSKAFVYQDSIQYMLKEGFDPNNITRDDIDPNIASAVAVASLNWIATKANKTINNDDRGINALLGRDSKHEVSEFEGKLLQGVGINYTAMAKDIGRDVVNIIGLKPKKTTTGEVSQNLENSIANHAVKTMLDMGLLEYTTIPTNAISGIINGDTAAQIQNKNRVYKVILNNINRGTKLGKLSNKNLSKFMEIGITNVENSKNPNVVSTIKRYTPELKSFIDVKELTNFIKSELSTVTPYIKITTKEETRESAVGNKYTNLVPSDKVQSLMDTVRNSDNILSEFFGTRNNKTGPLLEKPTKVVDTIRNSIMKVPSRVKDKLKIVQEQEYTLNKDSVDMLTFLGEENTLEIAGLDSTYLDTKHVSKHKSIEGKNATIIADYQDAIEFISNTGLGTPFYYTYQVWKSMRMGADSNTFNYQSSHLHRSLHGLTAHNVKIDTSNPVHTSKFLQAFAASMGIKADPNDASVHLQAIQDLVTLNGNAEHDQKTTTILNAVKAIQGGTDTPQAKRDIVDGAKVAGEQHYSLDGLIAYAKYLTAQETGGSFNTSLYREPDGIANGVAISLLQFVPTDTRTLLQKLRRVGIHTGLAPGSDPDKSDSYQDASRKWSQNLIEFRMALTGQITLDRENDSNVPLLTAISSLKTAYDNPAKALSGLRQLVGPFVNSDGIAVTELGRKLIKNPLMITNFGASIVKVIESFASSRISSIYDNIAEAQDDQNIIDIINSLNLILTGNKVSKINIKDVLDNPKTWVMSQAMENTLTDLISNTYGVTLQSMIQKEYGHIIDKRRILNKAAGMTFLAFKLQYDILIDKEVETLNGRLPSKERLDEINNSLLDQMPIFKAVLSSSNNDGILVMNKTTTADRDNALSKTQSRFNTSFDVNEININDLDNPSVNRTSRGDGQKSLTLFATKQSWENGGVSGPIGGIHNVDSATMLNTLKDFPGSNIHDAAVFDVLQADAGSKALNTEFFNANNEHSIMDEMHTMFAKVVGGMKTNNPTQYGKLEKLVASDKRLNETTLDEFTETFDKENKSNNLARESVFKQIRDVNQYTDGPGTNLNIETDTAFTNKDVKEFIDTTKDNSKDNSKFASSSEFNTESFQATQEKLITNKTSEQIYEDLGVGDPVIDSPEHDTRLRGLMDNIVNKVLTPLRLFMEDSGDVNQGILADNGTAVYMSNALPTNASMQGTAMSQRETYVHELFHYLTYKMVDGNSAAARKLRRFYLDIRDAKNKDGSKWLTGKDFVDPSIDKDSARYKTELELGNERYDKIFGNGIETHTRERPDPLTGKKKLQKLSSAHHEFLTIGVTNEAFIKKLSEFDSEIHKKKDTAESWLDSFTQLVTDLFNWISDIITDTNKRSGDATLYSLAGQLAGVDLRSKNNLWQYAENTGSVIGSGFDKLASALAVPFNAVVNNKVLGKSDNKLVKVADAVLKVIPHMDKIPEVVQTIRDSVGLTKESLASSIIHEMRGQHKDNTYLHDLSRESDKMDKNKLHIKSYVSKFVKDSFLTPVTTEQNKAMVSLLKTDIVSLFKDGNYDGELISKLYTDTKFVNKEISRIEKRILNEFKKNGKYYVASAKSMGHEMATGRPLETWSLLNANVIAELDGTKLKKQGDLKAAEALIDELATIQSIKSTDVKQRALVADIVNAEYLANGKDNGIVATLKLHKSNKDESLKVSFDGQHKLIIKGFIKEQYNSNKSFTVAPASHEKELLKQSFTKLSKLKKDTADPNKNTLYMYVSNLNTQGKFLSGIVSTTGKRAKGADIRKVYNQLGEIDPTDKLAQFSKGFEAVTAELDIKIIHNIKNTQSNQLAKGVSNTLKEGDGVLQPVFNKFGKVKNFRYKMDEATKEFVLGKNDALDSTLGAMQANIEDKRNTDIINNKVIQETFNYHRKNAREDNRGFVEIGPSSIDAHLQEIYRLLPNEFKHKIREVWGGDAMFVRAEEASLIFGGRELNLTNSFQKEERDETTSREWLGLQMNNAAAYVLNRKSARYVESIWKEVISMVKDAIVIKSGVVLLGNEISNNIVVKVFGVSTKDIIVSKAEGFISIKDHRKDTAELDNLLLKVKIDVSTKDKHKRRIAELQHSIAINPVTELIDAGMFQPIVEDVSLLEDPDSYQSRIGEWLDTNSVTKKLIDKTPNIIKEVSKHLVMAHDTAPYKFMRDMTQVSDFIARYTLHKHNLKKGMDPKESIDLITKAFINYTPPTHRYLQYANDMGFVMFTKFFFRIQAVIFHLAKERPGSLLASLVGQGIIGDVSDITDSAIVTGLAGRLNVNPLDLADEIINNTPAGQVLF